MTSPLPSQKTVKPVNPLNKTAFNARVAITVSIIAIVFAMVNVPSVSVWTAAGKQLSQWMHHPKYVRWFNGAMGGLLLLSVVPML